MKTLVGTTMWLVAAAGCVSPQTTEPVEVPFQSDFGLIWVQTTVNGSAPLWFLLDTGFEYSLIDAAAAQRLGLQVQDPQSVPQPGGTVEMGAVPDVQLAIGSIRVPPLTVQAVPLAGLEPVVGRSLHGILGHDVIARYLLTIDYERETLRFLPADTDEPLPEGTVLPLTIVANEPFVDGVIEQPHDSDIRGRFKLDTGSLDALGLNRNFLEGSDVLAPGQTTHRVPGIAVGGDTDGLLFRIAGFRLGPYTLHDPVIGATLASEGFEDRDDAGTIGAEVLHRFTVTLDYARARMVLAPNSHFADDPGVDRSGMWVVADGSDFSEFRVRFVLADGPAAAAGLEQGDVIVGVDGRSARTLRLVDLWRTWRQPDGTAVELEVRRGNQIRTLHLTLRSPV